MTYDCGLLKRTDARLFARWWASRGDSVRTEREGRLYRVYLTLRRRRGVPG